MNKWDFIVLMNMLQGKGKLDIIRIQKMGLLAVKIGQVYALRGDFLPAEKCKELSKLYRSNIEIPSEELLAKIDRSKFKHINEKPLATASIGQVYRAKLKNGEEVVIKIVKSDFKKKFKKEVKSIRSFVNFATFFYPKLKKVFDPNGVLDHIEEYTLKEMNLLNEIEGQERLRKIYSDNKNIYDLSRLKFPKIYKELSSEDVMVSEYIPGKTFDEILDKNMDYKQLLNLFKIHGFFMFNINTFHGDIHPGNLMLYKNKIYFIDTGAISHVSPKLGKGLLNFFDSLSKYDYKNCTIWLNKMGTNQISGKKFKDFEDKFIELYYDFKGKSVKEVSLTKKMMETIKLGVHSGIGFEKGMFSIIKSLMFLDGMVLRCNPKALLLEDMRKFVSEFKRN